MRILKMLQKLTVALALVVTSSALLQAPTQVQASEIKMTPTVITSSSNGGWIVGGIFFSVASIIACAMIVGAEEDREMTLEEALLSGAIPLGCLLREELGVSPD